MPEAGCDGLVEKYKNADKQRCAPGLKRKPGLDHLGTMEESEGVIEPSVWAPATPPAPPRTEVPLAKSIFAPLEHLKLGRVEEHGRLKDKRGIWELSLPSDFERHASRVTPGHTLEYINQGVPTPKKKPEEFSVSTKHKRRGSSQ